MEKTLPDWRKRLARGNFNDIKQWLTKNVHSQGNLYNPSDLIKRIAGTELDVKPYLSYLNKKYVELYGF
jgi:carboxypeptidase Taq